MMRDKRFHVFACSTNVYRHDRIWFQRTPFLAVGGINSALFYPKRITEREEDDPFIIMLYGRISEGVKGTGLIVRACEKLHKKYPFIRLLLFDTPVNSTMLALDNSFTTSVPFEFVMNHPVEKNVEMFHRADIFVSAEKQTGWANTVAEAMASGIPVVATRGGTLDMIVDNETGILVKRNICSLGKGIEKLILSEDLGRRLAENGNIHIQQFDWKNLARKILGWYERQEQLGKGKT
jgi:glycosyltransferase involved in cell wall biosynthesis